MAVGNQSANGAAVGPHIAPRTLAESGAAVNRLGDHSETGDADASGVCLLTFDLSADVGTHLEIERIAVVSNSAASPKPTVRVYVGAVDPAGFRDVTAAGTEDVALEQPPIYVAPQQKVLIRWTGCAAGDTCTATLQYRVRSDGT